MWIVKWVDYSDKYGFGYQLSDDSFGVIFNDTSKMVLIPDSNQIQYIDQFAQEHFYTKEWCPSELQKKLTLFNYFQKYMSENLTRVSNSWLFSYDYLGIGMYARGNIDPAVQIDPMILLVDLVRFESANRMFAISICTSLDLSELKINIHSNMYNMYNMGFGTILGSWSSN